MYVDWGPLCGLRSPSFESSGVLYISPTDTSSMQNLILEGLQQKLQKFCSRCNKNTRYVESSSILQAPKYLLLFAIRFRHINNNVTKNGCPIHMDTTMRLGHLKFSPQATIDHHGPSIYSGYYTASINCCKKNPFYCNDHTITEFGITDKNSSTAYVILYKFIDTWFLDSNRRVGVIYMCIPYMSSVIGRIYNGSVIQYWRSCTPSRSIGLYFWGVRCSWAECHFLFSLVYQLCLALW